ncbi:MAG: hypothetical protein ACREAA_15290 [Candidatus Polarisedimenticolia bacterium]
MRMGKVIAGFCLTLLCVGCDFMRSDVEEGATTTTSASEIPGTHSPGDLNPITAAQWVDHVKIGRKVDAGGEVPQVDVTDTFGADERIHVSMEVTDAPSGSVVAVTVVNKTTGQRVWSQQKSVEAGRSHLNFNLNASELGPGGYGAEVRVGDEQVALRPFVVNDTQA